MEKIGFEQFEEEDWIDYKNDDIIIIDDISKIPTNEIDGSVKLEMAVILICSHGKLEITINGEKVIVRANDALVCMNNTIISDVLMSPDMDMFALGLSRHSMNLNIFKDKNLWKYVDYINRHHVMKLTEDDFNMLNNYFEMTHTFPAKNGKHFQNKIIHYLQQAFLYELMSIAEHNQPMDENEETSQKQGDLLFKSFIIKLIENEGKIRQVSDFANELNVTPKYLSVVVKKTSGKTALQMIHEATIKEIEQQLIYTDYSIKEIATNLDFDNLSFFSKFVKKHLGMSPKNFRTVKAKK